MDIRGVIPVIQTPFTKDGWEIDYADLAQEIETVLDEGANGVTLFGVATEFFKLSDYEKERMMECTVETVNGRVPVIASITRNSTELAIKDAKKAKEIGVNALMAFSPHFLKPSTAALKQHIVEVANTVDLPFVIQYAPNVGGGALDVKTVVELCEEVSNKLYIKAECTPSAPFIEMLYKETQGKLGILTGNGGLHMLDSFDRGATGVMPGCSMVNVFVEFYRSHTEGNYERAKQIYDALAPMVLLTNQSEEMYIRYEKRVLQERGIFKSDYCRKPTEAGLDEKIWKDLKRYLQDIQKMVH